MINAKKTVIVSLQKNASAKIEIYLFAGGKSEVVRKLIRRRFKKRKVIGRD